MIKLIVRYCRHCEGRARVLQCRAQNLAQAQDSHILIILQLNATLDTIDDEFDDLHEQMTFLRTPLARLFDNDDKVDSRTRHSNTELKASSEVLQAVDEAFLAHAAAAQALGDAYDALFEAWDDVYRRSLLDIEQLRVQVRLGESFWERCLKFLSRDLLVFSRAFS